MTPIVRCSPSVAPRLRCLSWYSAGLVVLAILVGGCAQQIRDRAEDALRTGDYETAVSELEQGLKRYPDSPVLRAGAVQARNEGVARLVAESSAARAQRRLDEAETLLQRAKVLDAGSKRVDGLLAELQTERRQMRALTDAEALVEKRQSDAALRLIAAALKDNPRQAELLALQRRLEADARQRQLGSGQAALGELRPISLDFREVGLRTLLDAVTRHSGINFVLDKDIRADVRVTIYLRQARVEEAIDLIASTHQLAKKVLDGKTVLIYPNTPEKHREHQEQIVRVFYLASADAKGASAFLRSMLRIREPYIDERTNMLSIRESAENVALAERLIALYDTQEPEVLLEVEVIEVRSTRLTDLGVKLPDSFSLTVLPPAGETALTVGNLRGVNSDRIGVGVSSLLVNLKREVGDFTTLANPRIRARNKEKAKVLIGDKVPVITTTTAIGGFVSDSVSYLDVGLKLDVEPTVYADDEVAIRVALEVSSIAREVRTGSGSLAYQIGTRNASTLLRLRDGETQLLAGLISKEDRSSASRVPGVGDLPVLGRLFSSQRDDTQRTELVLAITPRVLRNIRRPQASETEIWVGTDSLPRLRPPGGWASAVEDTATAKRESGAAPGAAGGATAPAPRPAPVAAAGEAAGPADFELRWNGPAEVKLGEVFTASLQIKSGVPLRGTPLQLAFTASSLVLEDVEEGEFFRQGGAATSFTRSIDAAQGSASVGLLRNPATGASGEGTVLKLRLRAQAAGPAEVNVVKAGGLGAGDQVTPPSATPPLRLKVQ